MPLNECRLLRAFPISVFYVLLYQVLSSPLRIAIRRDNDSIKTIILFATFPPTTDESENYK